MPDNEDFNLINPDAYDYLDDVSAEDIHTDEMLAEQEELQDSHLFDDLDEVQTELPNQENEPYSSDLFSIGDYADDKVQEEVPATDFVEDASDEKEEIVEEIEETTEDIGDEETIDEETIDEEINDEEIKDEEPLMFEDDLKNDGVDMVENTSFHVSQELLSLILQKTSRYSPVKDFLKGLTEEQLEQLENMICETKNAWLDDHKDKMFSISSDGITFAVVKDTEDPLTEIQRFETLAVNMIKHDRENWSVVYLYFDDNGILIDARDRKVERSMFTERQWKIIEMQAGRSAR